MLEFDLSAFERYARHLDGAIDQVPYALSQALNQAVKNTREVLVRDTWPRSIQQRDPNFINYALRIREFANKKRLRVVIGENPAIEGRGHLSLHDKGGTKQGRRDLAIPSTELKAKRTGRGVPKNMRPQNLPNSFKKNGAIFQRQGKKGRKIKRMYTLKRSATIRKDVRFTEDFRDAMLAEVRTSFPRAMAKAMATRK